MHPSRLRALAAQAQQIKDIRADMMARGIPEMNPFTPGISIEHYGPNLKLWVQLHNGPKFFDLSMKEQDFHRRMSNWSRRYAKGL